MRGLILAAGRGSRMVAATADRPKGLVELGGTALLDWQLAALRGAGIQEIGLVRGYRGETPEHHMAHLLQMGATVLPELASRWHGERMPVRPSISTRSSLAP